MDDNWLGYLMRERIGCMFMRSLWNWLHVDLDEEWSGVLSTAVGSTVGSFC